MQTHTNTAGTAWLATSRRGEVHLVISKQAEFLVRDYERTRAGGLSPGVAETVWTCLAPELLVLLGICLLTNAALYGLAMSVIVASALLPVVVLLYVGIRCAILGRDALIARERIKRWQKDGRVLYAERGTTGMRWDARSLEAITPELVEDLARIKQAEGEQGVTQALVRALAEYQDRLSAGVS